MTSQLTFSGSGSRLSPLTTPPCERSPHMTLSLQEIIIVGSACEQAKFSELTMDMFRMLQTLEREPSESNHMHNAMHGTKDKAEFFCFSIKNLKIIFDFVKMFYRISSINYCWSA